MTTKKITAEIAVDDSSAKSKINAFYNNLKSKVKKAKSESEQAYKESEKKNKEIQKQSLSMVTTARRVAQIGFATAGAFGIMIDQSLQLGIEAGMMSIEAAQAIKALTIAEAPVNPLAVLSIGAQIAAITAMTLTIIKLQQGRTEAAQRMNYVVGAFRLITF